MPGNTRPACKLPEIVQISTGQAGAEVNRDLETLFKTCNSLIRCVGKLSDALDEAYSSGSTTSPTPTNGSVDGSGAGSGGGGGGGGGSISFPHFTSLSASATLPNGFDGIVFVAPGSNATITLPTPGRGGSVVVHHTGTSNTVTVNDDLSNTLAVLTAGEFITARQLEDGSQLAAWVTGAIVESKTGTTRFVGGSVLKRKAIADTNYTVLVSDCIVAYTSLTAARTCALPTAPAGQMFVIKDECGGSGANPITITSPDTKFDGVVADIVLGAYGKACVYSNGTSYFTW